MTPEEIRARRFTIRKWRPGYDPEQVDGLLEQAAITLTALAGGRRAGALLTGPKVRMSRFASTNLRPGYDQDEVDDFLDAVASALEAALGVAPAQARGPAAAAAARMSAEQVLATKFAATKYREGYDQQQVDALLDRAAAALAEAAAGRPFTHLLSGDEVRRARFTATKFRPGYDQDGVDDFLDQLAAALDA